MHYMADSHMATKVFSLAPDAPEQFRKPWPSPVCLESLREQLLKPFGFSLRGPLRVSLYPLGKEFVALHNFNDHPVTMWLKSEVGSTFEPVVTLPGTARTKVRPTEGSFAIELEAHSLTCLRLSA
jgi:hypothetical protein